MKGPEHQDMPGQVCPNCEQNEPEPVAPLLLLGLGGMLAFFSFAFWIVAMVAEPGMLYLALGLTLVGVGMMAIGWHLIRGRKAAIKKVQLKRLELAKCEYCGGQNKPGQIKCEFCGAPLF